MRTGTSRLLPAVFALLAAVPAAPRAAGLFDDPRSFFAPADTSRAVACVSQAEIDLGAGSASLLSLETRFRRGARTIVGLSAQFPAIRAAGDLAYGVGDLFASALVRIAGDTLNAEGLFLRVDVRVPTGSKRLVPFSYVSLDGRGGFEASMRVWLLSVRTAALYTLAGERVRGDAVSHDHHATLAGSLVLEVPRIGSASAFASWVRFSGGAAQETFCLSLHRELSNALALSGSAAAQTGDDGAAQYDWLVGVSLTYRFPPRGAPAPRQSEMP